jgi:hypothetical protein
VEFVWHTGCAERKKTTKDSMILRNFNGTNIGITQFTNSIECHLYD